MLLLAHCPLAGAEPQTDATHCKCRHTNCLGPSVPPSMHSTHSMIPHLLSFSQPHRRLHAPVFFALCLCDVMRTCCLAVSNATRSRWCGHLCCTLRRQSPPAELLHPACAVTCACDEAWIRHVRAAHHILCAPCRSHRSGACPLRRSAPSCSKSSTRPRTYSCSRFEQSKPTICLIPFRASPGTARQTPAPLVLGPQVEHIKFITIRAEAC